MINNSLALYIEAAGQLGAQIEFSILAKNEEYSREARERFRRLAENEGPMPKVDNDLFDDVNQQRMGMWRSMRRAVVHTLDINEKHSLHAQKIVKNFRQGMYFPHVDFHYGTVENYLESRLAETHGNVFLDHAILDLPDTQRYIELLGQALKPGGTLLTWNPNLTQVMACVDVVREQKLPFLLEKVLEVGAGGGNGGREWDVRRVRLRASSEPQPVPETPTEIVEEIAASTKTKTEEAVEVVEDEKSSVDDKARYEMVCRPKAGARVIGGGFIGLWRRMEQI